MRKGFCDSRRLCCSNICSNGSRQEIGANIEKKHEFGDTIEEKKIEEKEEKEED
jgi:hypothetical protein